MQFFYDGQIRRYITQIVRLMSNFNFKDGDGALRTIPVMYGDITRQVAHIMRDNSENKIMSAPRMGVYITNLELDRTRLADASYISKVHLRERAYDSDNNEYLNTQGNNYTVERLMPTPYTLSVAVDLWTTNTEQKLQIMEQILMLFNPSLEIQTTDNYVDWTSLSVVEIASINFSSRSIPTGTESEIDVATLNFTTPIYISPPTKVKKLGVVTQIIASIYNERTGNIDLGQTMPELQAYSDDYSKSVKSTITKSADGTIDSSATTKEDADAVIATTAIGYDLLVMNNVGQVIDKGIAGAVNWNKIIKTLPGKYNAGLSRILLNRQDINQRVSGTFAVNELNENQLIINWDEDTIPTDTIFTGVNSRGTVDYIIDPTKFNPSDIKQTGTRLLLLADVNNDADAWKNTNNSLTDMNENDIVEWNGSTWTVLFDASANLKDSEGFETKFITNLNTGIQYKWTGEQWLLSFEGEYRKGTWQIQL
tara:strand:- start:5521 stop:6963 length:1443 start_codon:yes stop_codon:yes gene_type:complete